MRTDQSIWQSTDVQRRTERMNPERPAGGIRAVQAFTITEVAIVTALLGILLVTILGVVSQSARIIHDIRLTARSSQVLQQKMEDIRMATWAVLTNYPSSSINTSSTDGSYTVTVTTNQYASYGGATTILLVTLTTTWTNFTSRVIETNRLTTLVTNGGLNQSIYN